MLNTKCAPQTLLFCCRFICPIVNLPRGMANACSGNLSALRLEVAAHMRDLRDTTILTVSTTQHLRPKGSWAAPGQQACVLVGGPRDQMCPIIRPGDCATAIGHVHPVANTSRCLGAGRIAVDRQRQAVAREVQGRRELLVSCKRWCVKYEPSHPRPSWPLVWCGGYSIVISTVDGDWWAQQST